MSAHGFIRTGALLALASVGAAFGGRQWARSHVQYWSGRDDLGVVSCYHCHEQSLDRLPWARPRPHHNAPAGMAVSPDGKKLFIALDDMDEVAEADVASRAVVRRATVRGGPVGLALDARGERLFVACREQDRVAALDTRDLQERASVDVGIYPTDVAYCRTPVGERLIVPNSGSDDVSVLSVSPLRELARAAAGREPYAAAASGDGQRVYIANRLAVHEEVLSPPAGEVTVLNPANGRVLDRERLQSAHLAEGIAAAAERHWMLNSLVQVRNLIPITQVADGWVMSSGLAISQPDGEVTQIPLDEANAYFADPSGVVADAGGHRAYVASGGGDVVTVVDLDRVASWLAAAGPQARQDAPDDLSLSSRYVIARIRTGRNPRRLALSPDGRTLFIAERLEDRVLVVDTASLKLAGEIILGDGGLRDPIRRGERVFTQARYSFQGQFSCRSCHPGGHMDGLSYDFDGAGIGDNFLDNRSLCGVAGTAPFKWNGKNPSLQAQDGPRFAQVLTRSDPIPPAQLDDLAIFIEHLRPTRVLPWRRVGKPLTPAEQRGRDLFFAAKRPDGTPIPRARRCQTCHRPPLFTDRLLSSVGTRGPRDPTGMFDTPQLLGIAASAPYLHDGRAKTLEEIWTTYQTNDLHGVSSYWSKEQLNDLVQYLKTL